VESVERLARLATEDHGLIPVFHPHAGTHVEFEDEIDRLAADTDVPLCIDTGHCAYTGIDPVALYERLAARVVYFHLKDVDRERLRDALIRELSFEQAVAERVFCPLGEGIVDFAALADSLERRDFHGWATVEQDRLPTDSTAPVEHAAASLAHLRAVGLA
jgi:inosose dehydratase